MAFALRACMTNSNQMTKKILIVFTLGAVALAFSPGFSLGDQTTGEKVEAKSHDAKRKVKKSSNRAKEALCAEGDVECAAKKAGHRAEEGADYVGDKASEGADKVDTDHKKK